MSDIDSKPPVAGKPDLEPNDPDVTIIQHLAPLLLQSTYTCGGSILVKDCAKLGEEGVMSPVVICWDSTSQVEKVVLPTTDVSRVQALVKSTQPASFGLHGKDVIDESYRKASKLDPTAFLTSFCPYEVGIIDTIGQALLPLPGNNSQGVRAELYKLNVYEGPSGMFKPHRDTPRSDLHFGSLVVCLPSAHEGGQLIVRHQGHSTTFDWSSDSSNLQWAAFYGDCEHEVSQVTSGHRVTLTYNLFLRCGLGQMVGANAVLDAAQLPVYKEVQAALSNPLFFPDGGLLGKYCSHAYAHTTEEGIKALPAVLKGSDMIAYETFKSLGIQVDVRPKLDIDVDRWFWDGSDDGADLVDELSSSRIGKTLTRTTGTSRGDEGDGLEEVLYGFHHDKAKVKWLNDPVDENKNVQWNHLVYGNQAEIDWAYSFCVLIMTIPPFSERNMASGKLDKDT